MVEPEVVLVAAVLVAVLDTALVDDVVDVETADVLELATALVVLAATALVSDVAAVLSGSTRGAGRYDFSRCHCGCKGSR